MGNFTELSQHLAKGAIDFSSVSFKGMLVSVAPTTANEDDWLVRTSVTNEAVGTGYTAASDGAGAIDLTATVEAGADSTTDSTDISFAVTGGNPALTNATITAVGMIIYVNVGTAATDKLISYVDFGGAVTSSNGNFNITITAPGLTITV